MKRLLATALIAGSIAAADAQQQKDNDSSMAGCPMMSEHAAMNKRGEKAMGFSQEKTTHHFRLAPDGGTIEVSANDPNDAAGKTAVRGHLSHIAMMFEHGNFEIPMLVHGKKPDGTDVMVQEKPHITYGYEETESGALVRIRADNPQALRAVHDFLRFEIKEHQTGDPMAVAAAPSQAQ